MQISKPDIRKLNVLAEGLDSLLSDINLQIKLLNQSQGIEYEAFLYTLDMTEIPSEDKGWALPSSYERDRVGRQY